MGKNLRNILYFTVQLLLASAIAAGAALLLWRYARYGQQKNGENGIRQTQEQDENDAHRTMRQDENSVPQTLRQDEAKNGGALQNKSWEMIRVRIKDQDFANDFHDKVRLSCKKAFTVTDENGTVTQYAAGEKLDLGEDDIPKGSTVCAEGADGNGIVLESITRDCGMPKYSGKLYLTGTSQGIEVINELPIEEYLASVVASEMPSSYPEEAQKAQAVCARTYARNCIRQNNGQSPADLDDSVSFQVYNNQKSTKKSKKAVKETAGIVLPLNEIQYYSTSGLTEKRRDLGSEAAFTAFLDETPAKDAQYGSPWVRWSTEIPVDKAEKELLKAYEDGSVQIKSHTAKETESENAGGKMELTAIGREPDGQITFAELYNDGKTYLVEGEYTFRRIFGCEESEIVLRDGSSAARMRLLPSAFCTLERIDDTFLIRGCGYGHGNGMSQCGAAEMAVKGLDYREILKYYYGVAPVGGTENADGERET